MLSLWASRLSTPTPTHPPTAHEREGGAGRERKRRQRLPEHVAQHAVSVQHLPHHHVAGIQLLQQAQRRWGAAQQAQHDLGNCEASALNG